MHTRPRLPLPAFAPVGFALVALALAGCSSDATPSAAPGTITLEAASSKHATSVLRFTLAVKNGNSKAVKTLDTIELDAGDGAKRASLIQGCDTGAIWLPKAGGGSPVEFTVRGNGPDRMVVEGPCNSGKALWEFQTFVKIDTNGSAPLKISMTGTYDDGAIWTASVTATR